MMPVLGSIGGIPIASWPLFFAIASLVGLLVFRVLWNRELIRVEQSAEGLRTLHALPNPEALFVVFYLGGFAGARLVGAFETNSLSVSEIFSLGPMSFFGGVGGALIAGAPLLWRYRRSLPVLADAALPALALGLGLGRFGCLLNGDDYGAVMGTLPEVWWTRPMWGMVGAGPESLEPVMRYATQLEEALFALGLGAVTAAAVARRVGANGANGISRFPSGVLGFGVGAVLCLHRMWNDFFRADHLPEGGMSGVLSSAQEWALALGMLSGVGVVWSLVWARAWNLRHQREKTR